MRTLTAAQRTARLDPQDPVAAARLEAEAARHGVETESEERTYYLGRDVPCFYWVAYPGGRERREGSDLESLFFHVDGDGDVETNADRAKFGKIVINRSSRYVEWTTPPTCSKTEARALYRDALNQGWRPVSIDEIYAFETHAAERENGLI